MARISDDVLSHLDGVLFDPDRSASSMQDPETMSVTGTPITEIAGRFHIRTLLGRGGMSEVYRAFDERTGREVALKVQHAGEPWLDQRFVREAEALRELRHPALVAYEDHGKTHDGVLYLATAVVEGPTLAARLAEGPLPLAPSLRVSRDIAGALGVLHERGFVHRDVKPANVLLARDGAKLLDLGLLGSEASVLTETGALLGTVGYLSPEQARASRRLDARADVFALGCVLFECLTGAPPFGRSLAEVTASFAMGCAPPMARLPSDTPAAVRALLEASLREEPSLRPRDGAAFAKLSDQALATLGAGDIDALMSSTLGVEDGAARPRPALPFVSAAPAPPVVARDKTRPSPATAPHRAARIDLLHFDTGSASEIRAACTSQPGDVDRAAIARVLARARSTSTEENVARCERALDDGGPRPLSVVDGALELAFEPREARRAQLAAVTPLLAADRSLSEAHAAALESMRTPGGPPSGVAAAHRDRIDDLVRKLDLSALRSVEAVIQQSLVEARAYARRRMFGGTFVRASLTIHGEPIAIPTYLPEEAADQLPLASSIPSRLVVELRPPQDAAATSGICYRVLAVARWVGTAHS